MRKRNGVRISSERNTVSDWFDLITNATSAATAKYIIRFIIMLLFIIC